MSLYLTARLLEGVPHGFTTRLGGVSRGPFESLNLGRRVGDDEGAIRYNHRRLAAAARFELETLITPEEQVHGDRVVNADEPGPVGKCDGVATATRHRVVGIRVADCVPLLLWDPGRGAVAALHAGWRGVAAGIASRGVALLRDRFETDPGSVRAAIGPAVGLCCYEVDDATADQLRAAAPSLPVQATRPGHLKVDLRAALREQLRSAGVREIETVGGCTACERELFFSHRRDRGRTGRHLAFIGVNGKGGRA